MKFDNSSAIVTGGASGLGLAVVKRLAAEGVNVVFLDLPSSNGAGVAAALGGLVRFFPGDVTDEVAVSAALDAAEKRAPLRIVVNVAGTGDALPVWNDGKVYPLESFERVVRVNLIGTFNLIRLASARMGKATAIDGERGVIINTSSVASFDGRIGQSAYAASKAAINGFTLPLARDLGRALIRVVTVAPGLFRTPPTERVTDAALADLMAQVAHPKRLGLPEEFADFVAHIVGNAMLNGEVIRLDAGVRLGIGEGADNQSVHADGTVPMGVN